MLHPLFSSDYYRLANPDLADAGVSLWSHYQVFGRNEERAPHPLIDLHFLVAGLGDIGFAEAIDWYLADPGLWATDPGPYVDCVRFMLFGEWDRVTHPLVQIVQEQLRSQWVHARLMLVDAASNVEATARLAGVGYLLSRHASRNRLSRFERWGPGSESGESSEYTVVPGFLLAVGATLLSANGPSRVSPDESIVRLETEAVGIRTGAQHSTSSLIWLDGDLSRRRLASIVADAADDAVIAPRTSAQETSLRQLRRDTGRSGLTVLESGAQARISAESVHRVEGEPPLAIPEWIWRDSAENGDLAIVIPQSQRWRATGDPALRAALAAGASLCLISDGRLNSWLPQLQSRDAVAVDPTLLPDVAAFVDESTLHVLPPADARLR
jgi:hypothetical protein